MTEPGGEPRGPLQQLGAAPGTSAHPAGIGAPGREDEDGASADSFADALGGAVEGPAVRYGPVGGRRSRWDETPEMAAARGAAEAEAAVADALAATNQGPAASAGLDPAEQQELEELLALEAQHLAQQQRQKDELARLRAWRVSLLSTPPGLGGAPGAPARGPHYSDYARGRLPGTPSLAERRAALGGDLGGAAGGSVAFGAQPGGSVPPAPQTPGFGAQAVPEPQGGPTLSPESRAVRRLASELDHSVATGGGEPNAPRPVWVRQIPLK